LTPQVPCSLIAFVLVAGEFGIFFAQIASVVKQFTASVHSHEISRSSALCMYRLRTWYQGTLVVKLITLTSP